MKVTGIRAAEPHHDGGRRPGPAAPHSRGARAPASSSSRSARRSASGSA